MKKTIASHIGLNPETQKKMLAGELEVDLVPQGTLIERIRAGGFGLGGVLTATGVGTVVEKGKQRSRSTASSTCSRRRYVPISRWWTRFSPTTSATSTMR